MSRIKMKDLSAGKAMSKKAMKKTKGGFNYGVLAGSAGTQPRISPELQIKKTLGAMPEPESGRTSGTLGA